MQTSAILYLAVVAAFVCQDGVAVDVTCPAGYKQLDPSAGVCTSEAKLCRPGYSRFPNNVACYKVFSESKTYQEAIDTCKADYNGRLPQVTSANDHQDFGNAAVTAGTDLWIGLTDKTTEGAFVWSLTGEALTTSYWLAGQPNDADNNEDCVHYCIHDQLNGGSAAYGWNDENCGTKNGFICESEPYYATYIPQEPEPVIP